MTRRWMTVAAVGLVLVGAVRAASDSPEPVLGGPIPGAADELVAPHERYPDRWPQPDYLGLTLQAVGQGVEPRYRSLRLRRIAGAPAPALIVLPPQGQAFGFGVAFRAIVAAHLDRELATRGVDANRQTDIVDIDGPFARQLDDAAVAALSAQHPGTPMLALHLGHDGVASAFLTLTLRQGDKSVRAHKTTPLADDLWQAADQLARQLPALLSELGFGRPMTTESGPSSAGGCPVATWALADPPVRAPAADRACHAIAVGTLLPNFERPAANLMGLMSPAKAAWLAGALVESAPLAGGSASLRAVQELARAQLDIGPPSSQLLALDGLGDPVVEPLLRLVSARQRFSAAPVASARDAIARYVEPVAVGLPAFARAVFLERARHDDDFRRVDFCAIERAYPAALFRATCAEPPAGSRRAASSAELALYQEWRLAAPYKDLKYFGATQGQKALLADALRTLPSDAAAHPYLQQLRFTLRDLQDGPGGFDGYLERVRAAVKDFVQATANVQDYGPLLALYSLSEHSWMPNAKVLNDEVVRRASDIEGRLIAAMRYDRFVSHRANPALRRQAGAPAAFLAPLAVAALPVRAAPQTRSDAPPKWPGPLPPSTSYFLMPVWPDSAEMRKHGEAMIRTAPKVIDLRVEQAMVMLRDGAPLADAMAVIDDMPQDQRVEAQVSRSHAQSLPAHAMYFAGELEAARKYYALVREIGTGSDSDLLAGVRLRLLDGDLSGATVATEARLKRYESDFARRDLAGLLFMKGEAARAWQVLIPRLPTASHPPLWDAALVGHRSANESLAGVQQWLSAQRLTDGRIQHASAGAMLLLQHAVVDRLPSDEDIALLREADDEPRWSASARLARMALTRTEAKESFDDVKIALVQASDERNSFMLPHYVWVAWQVTEGKDPMLERVRRAGTTEADFDTILAKSMLLARERKLPESLRYLRAARYRMFELNHNRRPVQPVPAAYQFVLAAHLMAGETGEDAYRQQALAMARSYQKVFPFMAWTYAAEALMQPDVKARSVAACRARALDRQSMFLQLASQQHGRSLAACQGAPW